jgi:NAD(P)H-hydrate epimerase
MCGAAYLAAHAAYRVGAGLVRILTVRENLIPLQTLLPEAIVSVYDAQEPDPRLLWEAEAWADVLVIGCGLGVTPTSRKLLSELLRKSHKPKVLDADALNLLAHNPSLMKYVRGSILTPHPAEMSRLCGRSVEEILADSALIAHEFAKEKGVVCVLKRHRTVISDGGETVWENGTGNSGMATGGSGDVLAGILGGLWAQGRNEGLTALDCAVLGVFLHGACGDLAARELSEYSVMAGDLVHAIPQVLRAVERTELLS